MEPRLSETRRTIERRWTIDDCLDAHLMLDEIDRAEGRARAEAARSK